MISDSYRQLQTEMHKNPDYGVASVYYAPLVADFLIKSDSRTILDYGAGKCRLAYALERILPQDFECTYHAYEPAFAHLAESPEPRDFVACIDVLEHVEPDHLEAVLDDLARVTLKHGFFTVHTGPAAKSLPDGRNAHLIQRAPAWWLEKIEARFLVLRCDSFNMGFWVYVQRKTD